MFSRTRFVHKTQIVDIKRMWILQMDSCVLRFFHWPFWRFARGSRTTATQDICNLGEHPPRTSATRTSPT